MDKTKSPRGQTIENLDDFKYWLTHMERLASMKRPFVKHQMLELIKEASLLQIYDDDNVSDLVDKIDNIQNESIVFGLKKSFLDAEELHKQTLEFKFNCEKTYGIDEAFNYVVNQFEIYILETLKPIKKMDSVDQDFKRKVIEYLEEAKKKKSTNIEDSWRCLCLIDRNIKENLAYFHVKIQEANKERWVSKSPYEKFENEITELVKQVISGKILKIDARRDIWVLKNGVQRNIKEVKVETLNDWITNYKETGRVFEKPQS